MTSKPAQSTPASLSTLEGFICGGIAACIAVHIQSFALETYSPTYTLPQVTVSNPAEVAKTRLQLQGELAKGGVKKVYKGPLDVLAKAWRNEGIRGLQRGLTPAVSPRQLPSRP